MSGIQLGGLATGLDTSGLIQQMLAIDQQPITLLQTQKAKYTAVSTAFQDLNTKLATLKSKADALTDPERFFSRSVSSSDTTVATASAVPGSTRGTFTLTANDLARGSIATATATKASLTDTIAAGDGTFQFKLGATGSVVSVTVDATTTLEGLAKLINDKAAGVRAFVVNAGDATAPAYKLTLTSNATGAANDITIVHDDTTLTVANTQTATDAKFSISGLGSFTRASNTFSDVIDGVTITLASASGSTDLAIDYDKGATQTRVQSLLDAYNSVVQTINGQSASTTAADGTVTPGAFSGDAVPRMIAQRLASIVATSLGGSYATLATVGVKTEKDGTLTLDATQLQDALATDPVSVGKLFAGDGASVTGIAELLSTRADSDSRDVTGTIAVRRDGLTKTIQDLQSQIDAAQRRLSAEQDMLQARFNNLEQIVAQLQQTGSALLSALGQTLVATNSSKKTS